MLNHEEYAGSSQLELNLQTGFYEIYHHLYVFDYEAPFAFEGTLTITWEFPEEIPLAATSWGTVKSLYR